MNSHLLLSHHLWVTKPFISPIIALAFRYKKLLDLCSIEINKIDIYWRQRVHCIIGCVDVSWMSSSLHSLGINAPKMSGIIIVCDEDEQKKFHSCWYWVSWCSLEDMLYLKRKKACNHGCEILTLGMDGKLTKSNQLLFLSLLEGISWQVHSHMLCCQA